jgi:hypothetical protein
MRVRTFSALRQLVKEGDLAMDKYPYMQFYIGDWMKDPALRSVSYAARGLWMDMLCLMFESPRRGFLEMAEGVPFSCVELTRCTGGTHPPAVALLLKSLERANVYSKTKQGVIYSRRMVRDEEIRKSRASGGIKSTEHPNVPQPKSGKRPSSTPSLPPSFGKAKGYPDGPLSPPPLEVSFDPSLGVSLSVSVSESESDTKNNPLKTLVDVPPTQAPSATSPGAIERAVSDEIEKPEEPDERRPEDLKLRDGQIIEALFNSYCDELHRDRSKYTLTPIRKAKALLRLHERQKIRGSLAFAVDEINTAIKNLAASEWHVTNGHVDWNDQIFRSAEEFEKRLNWVKPNGGKSHADSYETREQRNERRFKEALNRVDHDSIADDEQPETERDS